MSGQLRADNINATDFDAALSRYETHIPSKLTELEELRLSTIPAALKARRQNAKGVWLEKEELQQLVEWKLKHGTYRPTLAKLVASNAAGDIKSITQAAFEEADKISGDDISSRSREALNILVKLKGVGPATAALILSSYDPARIPFFSDELFRWLHWDGKNASGKPDGIKQVGKGWSRQIGYTLKEYSELCASNEKVRRRLKKEGREVSSVEVEKVAYVLGKEGVNVDEASKANGSETSKLSSKNDDGATNATFQSKSNNKRSVEIETSIDQPKKRQKEGTVSATKSTADSSPEATSAKGSLRRSARSSHPS